MRTKLSYPRRNRKSGFSLVEILIVIALIAILATVTIGGLDGIFGGQQEKVANIFVNQSTKIGFQAYKLDIGSYPTSEQGLSALLKAPAGSWKGKEGRWQRSLHRGRPRRVVFVGLPQKILGATPTNTASLGLKTSTEQEDPRKRICPKDGTKNINGARGYDRTGHSVGPRAVPEDPWGNAYKYWD